MASKEQSVTLLRKNKRELVEALNAVGFRLDEGARAADFPMYVKWGAGLLDVTVAANRKSDNKRFFMTVDEWLSLSATEQSGFLLRGVRLRACGQSFVIAPDNILDKTWGASVSIPGVHNPLTNKDYMTYFDALEETRVIVEGLSGSGGAPAADAATNYKAFTLERDGLEDDTEWCLPTMAHLYLMFRYRREIESAITSVWSAEFKFRNNGYWSCLNFNTTQAFVFRLDYGSGFYLNKTQKYDVRPIAMN